MTRRLSIAILNSATAALVMVLFEWLFFFTQPSTLSDLGFVDAAVIGLSAGFFTATLFGLVAALTLLPLALARFERPFIELVAHNVVAIIIATVTMLLLLDNFTLTVLGFGIRTATGPWRLLYFGPLLLFVWWSIRGARRTGTHLSGDPRALRRLATSVGAIVAAGAWCAVFSHPAESANAMPLRPTRSPNVIMLASDGIDADTTSIYGYQRPTTPNMKELIDTGEFMVFENAFSNGAGSSASILSMLTGRLPTQTGFLAPPDTLRGDATTEHLPGLLRRAGYTNHEISVRHWADMYDLNMHNGFDWANFRSLRPSPIRRVAEAILGNDAARFLHSLWERIRDRLQHIAWVSNMGGPVAEVIDNDRNAANDDRRMEALLNIIEHSRRPFFVHIHLMGTHGPLYYPKIHRFSSGEVDRPWDIDSRDDAIADFDAHVRRVVEALKSAGIYDDTILIINTDHGYRWNVHTRLPLLIRLPHGEHAGAVIESVQLLDLAPTIVDYLGLPQPAAMGGVSLLKHPLPAGRRIWCASRDQYTNIGMARVLYRQSGRWYSFSLRDQTVSTGAIAGFTGPPPSDPPPGGAELNAILRGHLRDHGYDPNDPGRPGAGWRKPMAED